VKDLEGETVTRSSIATTAVVVPATSLGAATGANADKALPAWMR
jgi:hypothetical protein